MLTLIIQFVTDYLLVIMGSMLSLSLIVRYLAYRSFRDDQAYYSTFTRELEKKIQQDSMDNLEVKSVDTYVEELLQFLASHLPKRKLRKFDRDKTKDKGVKFQNANVTSLREYVGGSNSIIHGIQSEMTVFKGVHPPDFAEVTDRIMEKDEHWLKLYGYIKIDKISRLIDALPGMFIVLGIFGTFIGISNALPQIANIDFNNIESSSGVLSSFVLDVTFAMKTSIAGILCSLCLSLVNTLYPITQMRDQIATKFETSLENLWFFLQGDTPEKKRDVVFGKMLKSLEVMEGRLEELNRSILAAADKKAS